MITFMVHLHIKPEAIQTFLDLSLANARGSALEPGWVRFDVLQDEADPCRFVFYEVWADAEAHAAHRETPHYQTWRRDVEALQAEPRHSVRYGMLTPLARP